MQTFTNTFHKSTDPGRRVDLSRSLYSQQTSQRPQAGQISGQPAAPGNTALVLLAALYDGQAGWCEVSWITGDPSVKAASTYSREWHKIAGPADYPALVQRCGELGELAGNVYISSTLYSERRRSVDCALPSRVIFIDDAPSSPPIPYSLAIQTSQASQHGYYLLDSPISNEQRRAISARAAAALGADPSGVDLTQIVRVPGTFNTKGGGRWAVQLTHSSTTPASLADLLATFPELPTPAAPAAQIDDSQAAWWLGNITLLLDSQGIPRRLKNARPAVRDNFARAAKGDYFAQASGRSDSSVMRQTLANSLIMRGYTDSEAAALLYHFTAAGSEHKGGQWLAADIERTISNARAKYAHVAGNATPVPSRYKAQFPCSLPAAPAQPRGKGRPQRVDADSLLVFYQQRADSATHCLMARAAVCGELGIGSTTLHRLESQLTERGAIHRQTSGDRRSSWVVFGPKPADLGLSKNTESCQNAAADPAIFEHTSIPLESHETVADQPYRSTHAPSSTTAGPPSGRSVAAVCTSKTGNSYHPGQLAIAQQTAREYLASSEAASVNRQTGEIGQARHTFKRFAVFYSQQTGQPGDSNLLQLAYTAARREQKNSTFVLFASELRSLSDSELVKLAESKRRTVLRNAGKRRESFYRALLKIAHREVKRRGLTLPPAAEAVQDGRRATKAR